MRPVSLTIENKGSVDAEIHQPAGRGSHVRLLSDQTKSFAYKGLYTVRLDTGVGFTVEYSTGGVTICEGEESAPSADFVVKITTWAAAIMAVMNTGVILQTVDGEMLVKEVIIVPVQEIEHKARPTIIPTDGHSYESYESMPQPPDMEIWHEARTLTNNTNLVFEQDAIVWGGSSANGGFTRIGKLYFRLRSGNFPWIWVNGRCLYRCRQDPRQYSPTSSLDEGHSSRSVPRRHENQSVTSSLLEVFRPVLACPLLHLEVGIQELGGNEIREGRATRTNGSWSRIRSVVAKDVQPECVQGSTPGTELTNKTDVKQARNERMRGDTSEMGYYVKHYNIHLALFYFRWVVLVEDREKFTQKEVMLGITGQKCEISRGHARPHEILRDLARAHEISRGDLAREQEIS
ncbi:hypothetical protein EDD18DRAFT_1115611 [Armillaria luteobubalina]|uniref:Uncharacterized protein n=1 Tax=Armillaria luteobubalina TaxID=153913 RepID=A0AA39P2C6_9AGAR|nr:hypothetical protein EDD18DRAFT_1115611 [Armillaria luteobubalina]